MPSRKQFDDAIKRADDTIQSIQKKNNRQAKSIDRLLRMTLAGVEALEKIKRESGTSTKAWKIANDALIHIEALREADRNASSGNPEESSSTQPE